ncbi:aspartate aminotransferase family protein [Agrobacterium tumefaciens]|uniref:aspartate aminotransferase family protein n=1 Tax=Agrobacterium tumefaciens TaxID=358 RepID=UPI001573BD39|nr:aspartate aminotransferase family protein [Agrobacterium tumefaciens]NTE65529.1 aspartate aminotransferase family protein [Agrobacterium tumefaciens]
MSYPEPPHSSQPGANLAATAQKIIEHEAAEFAKRRPRSKAMFKDHSSGFFSQVPQYWMRDWPMPFPIIVSRAAGSLVTDIDENAVVDYCLGDTGAMFGHAPPPIIEAMAKSSQHGLTTMLPSEDAVAVGSLLSERFCSMTFQVTATASDANRFALRVARAVTGRKKILVFDGCYHGAVDDTLVDIRDGKTIARESLLGQAVDLGETTVCIPFNDLDALRTALSTGEIAVVLAEPVMTNCGMILPEPGYHQALRELTRSTGTLLLIDETHTISTGLGGYTAVHGLEPDIFVVGKPIGGGIPVAVWGMTRDVAEALDAVRAAKSGIGHSGIGTTLSGSAFQLACLRACLEMVMTGDAYATMNRHADQLEKGFTAAIRQQGLPWHISRVGARLEIVFAPEPVRNAQEAREAAVPDLQHALHLSMLNLGYLLTPFHNMVLVAPTTTSDQINGLLEAFSLFLSRLVPRKAAA